MRVKCLPLRAKSPRQARLPQADLFADTRLGGVQGLRRGGHIQVVTRHFTDITQLLEFHDRSCTLDMPKV